MKKIKALTIIISLIFSSLAIALPPVLDKAAEEVTNMESGERYFQCCNPGKSCRSK